jgi:hypothetical protein
MRMRLHVRRFTVYSEYRYYWRRSRWKLENVVANAGHGVKYPRKWTITIVIETSIPGEILSWNLYFISLLMNDLLLFYVLIRFSRSFFHIIDFRDVLNFGPPLRRTVNFGSSPERTQGGYLLTIQY